MSISPQIIYNCDHIIVEKSNKHGYTINKRNRNSSDPDKIPANTKILRIDKITSMDGLTEYHKDIHYKQSTSSNIIEWIESKDFENPQPGDSYKILSSYIESNIRKEKVIDCERCCGNGWYIDILRGGMKTYSAEGQSKLVQDFIKVLFTDRLAEDGYGSDIKTLIGKNINDPNMPSEIMNCVNEAARQLTEMQQENAINGVIVTPDETLLSVEITKVLFVRDELAYYVAIRLTNAEENDAIFSFKI